MIRVAAARYPQLRLIHADVHRLPIRERFDYVILSDLVSDLWDVQTVLERVASLCTSRTRLIVNSYSRLWELPLAAARKLRLANPLIERNWFSIEDLSNLLNLCNFEVIRHWEEILFPLRLPLFDTLCNRYLVRLFPFRFGALTNFLIARPLVRTATLERKRSVSVIVPARDESGNIAQILQRVPEMGAGTEIVFVEGHSKDDTFATIERCIADYPHRRCKLLRQRGVGKGDAVRQGFESAEGEVFMILDADLTVAPEDLSRFHEALSSGRGELINGVRLVYPIEGRSMRFFNLVANKLFSLSFSWVLGQRIKDTLCGTKALSRKDYQLICKNRSFFGDFDPFGDFDLIFGAARLNLKIVDLPIRYRQRTYGETKIDRWRHGWLLLHMLLLALKRLKFV
jgi:hypothetical protein